MRGGVQIAERRGEREFVAEPGADGAADEVGFAEEVGDLGVCGAAIELARRPELSDASGEQNGHAVGDGKGFLLVVCDVDAGESEFFAEPLDLGAHFESELGVEVTERLVEEKAIGSDDECAGECDALLLTAGELIGLSACVVAHSDHFERFGGAARSLGARHISDCEAEGDVGLDGHVGPKGVVLKDHGAVALLGWYVGDVARTEVDRAFVGGIEAGDAAEEGGLTTAGGAEEKEEFALLDLDGDVVEGADRAEAFDDVSDGNGGHAVNPCWFEGDSIPKERLSGSVRRYQMPPSALPRARMKAHTAALRPTFHASDRRRSAGEKSAKRANSNVGAM